MYTNPYTMQKEIIKFPRGIWYRDIEKKKKILRKFNKQNNVPEKRWFLYAILHFNLYNIWKYRCVAYILLLLLPLWLGMPIFVFLRVSLLLLPFEHYCIWNMAFNHTIAPYFTSDHQMAVYNHKISTGRSRHQLLSSILFQSRQIFVDFSSDFCAMYVFEIFYFLRKTHLVPSQYWKGYFLTNTVYFGIINA